MGYWGSSTGYHAKSLIAEMTARFVLLYCDVYVNGPS